MKKSNQSTSKDQNDTIEKLQKENKQLQMEVDYLKKLQALVQEKEKSKKDTGHK